MRENIIDLLNLKENDVLFLSYGPKADAVSKFIYDLFKIL
jgi:hypothetical protein